MFDISSRCLSLWKTSSLHLMGLHCIKLLLDHSKNLLTIPAPKSLFLKTGATVLQSPTFLKPMLSSPILIDKSFRKMLNKYGPLIFPCIVPINASLIYLLPITVNVIIYHPLCSVMWKIQPPIDYIYGFREMFLNLFARRLWFTESKTLLKSIVNILTTLQVGSSSFVCFVFLLRYQLSSNFKATGVHLCFTMFMGLFRSVVSLSCKHDVSPLWPRNLMSLPRQFPWEF